MIFGFEGFDAFDGTYFYHPRGYFYFLFVGPLSWNTDVGLESVDFDLLIGYGVILVVAQP